jgi:hypothetical protein
MSGKSTIDVKCPKCRFRYTVDVPASAKEVSCVCPRCGVPFIEPIPEDFSATSMVDDEPTFTPPEPPVDNKVEEEKPEQHNVTPLKPQDFPSHVALKMTPEQKAVHKRKQHRFSVAAVIGIVILVFLIIFSKTHNDNVDDSVTQFFSLSDTHHSNIPKWLEGSWFADTPYGKLYLVIHGNQIAETFNDKNLIGTFYYKDGKIHCHFKNGEYSTYALDEKDKRILTGHGYKMDCSE